MGYMVRGMSGWATDWIWNIGGTQSPDQKEALIQQCIADQIKAAKTPTSGITPEYARSICEPTITASLTSRQADPSQAGVVNALSPSDSGLPNLFGMPDFSDILKWGLLGLAGIVGLVIVTR